MMISSTPAAAKFLRLAVYDPCKDKCTKLSLRSGLPRSSDAAQSLAKRPSDHTDCQRTDSSKSAIHMSSRHDNILNQRVDVSQGVSGAGDMEGGANELEAPQLSSPGADRAVECHVVCPQHSLQLDKGVSNTPTDDLT